jgi:hypothetical protein
VICACGPWTAHVSFSTTRHHTPAPRHGSKHASSGPLPPPQAYGVYEGSYWELLRDLQELGDILKSMSTAPALMDEPVLALPPDPCLPTWDDFKPALQALPATPTAPALKLPPFKSPLLATELPFLEPMLLPVPDAPEAVQVLHTLRQSTDRPGPRRHC